MTEKIPEWAKKLRRIAYVERPLINLTPEQTVAFEHHEYKLKEIENLFTQTLEALLKDVEGMKVRKDEEWGRSKIRIKGFNSALDSVSTLIKEKYIGK